MDSTGEGMGNLELPLLVKECLFCGLQYYIEEVLEVDDLLCEYCRLSSKKDKHIFPMKGKVHFGEMGIIHTFYGKLEGG